MHTKTGAKTNRRMLYTENTISWSSEVKTSLQTLVCNPVVKFKLLTTIAVGQPYIIRPQTTTATDDSLESALLLMEAIGESKTNVAVLCQKYFSLSNGLITFQNLIGCNNYIFWVVKFQMPLLNFGAKRGLRKCPPKCNQ